MGEWGGGGRRSTAIVWKESLVAVVVVVGGGGGEGVQYDLFIMQGKGAAVIVGGGGGTAGPVCNVGVAVTSLCFVSMPSAGGGDWGGGYSMTSL